MSFGFRNGNFFNHFWRGNFDFARFSFGIRPASLRYCGKETKAVLRDSCGGPHTVLIWNDEANRAVGELRSRPGSSATTRPSGCDSHHHFFCKSSGELTDIDSKKVHISKFPKIPKGKKLNSIEIIVNISD